MTYTRAYRVDTRVLTKNPKLICSAFNNPGSTIKGSVPAMFQKIPGDLNYVVTEAKHKLPLLCLQKELRG